MSDKKLGRPAVTEHVLASPIFLSLDIFQTVENSIIILGKERKGENKMMSPSRLGL